MSASTDSSSFEDLEPKDDAFAPTDIRDRQERVGRYELVYELGHGGMANVYLARSRGPAGFHKFFAIKRIHRHLQKDPRFVGMFLDEARIAAQLQHPNVAQVFELGEADGERFIAMEYLHGEHLGALSARAANELGRVPCALAARIVAHAADGLHHAHEVKGPTGKPLDLVHRDVSPQNIFITYDGQVKLTDFGIAKAADRITQTEARGIKGKVAYMAPEQALGREIDRRTDVFALGIVLFETSLGRRLFRAETAAQTLMRITSGRIPKPHELEPDYPPALERIVLRALHAKPEERYPTAAAMARDLDRFLASYGEPAGAPEIAALMKGLFADRMAKKEHVLRSDPELATLIDVQPVEPATIANDGVHFAKTAIAGADHSQVRRRRPRGFVAALAALSAIAAAVAVGAVLFVDSSSSEVASRGVVRIDTEPAGASVVWDGARWERTTPVLLEDISHGEHTVRVELDGYRPAERTVLLDDDRLDLTLALVEVMEPVAPASGNALVAQTETEAADGEDTAGEDGNGEETGGEETGGNTGTAVPSTEPAVSSMETSPAARGYASLNLLTQPWATVAINGRWVGATPLFRQRIPAGRTRLTLRAEGTGPPRTIVIRAAPGETVSRRIDL